MQHNKHSATAVHTVVTQHCWLMCAAAAGATARLDTTYKRHCALILSVQIKLLAATAAATGTDAGLLRLENALCWHSVGTLIILFTVTHVRHCLHSRCASSSVSAAAIALLVIVVLVAVVVLLQVLQSCCRNC
jgi:hypothetical protein